VITILLIVPGWPLSAKTKITINLCFDLWHWSAATILAVDFSTGCGPILLVFPRRLRILYYIDFPWLMLFLRNKIKINPCFRGRVRLLLLGVLVCTLIVFPHNVHFTIQQAYFRHCWFSSGHLLPWTRGKTSITINVCADAKSCFQGDMNSKKYIFWE